MIFTKAKLNSLNYNKINTSKDILNNTIQRCQLIFEKDTQIL